MSDIKGSSWFDFDRKQLKVNFFMRTNGIKGRDRTKGY